MIEPELAASMSTDAAAALTAELASLVAKVREGETTVNGARAVLGLPPIELADDGNVTERLEVRLYARQGGKQRALQTYLDSLPESDRRNVRVFTRREHEEGQRRRREALAAEVRELDAEWFA